MSIEYQNKIFSFENDDEMEKIKMDIYSLYNEERGCLEHSCEGTSESQLEQFEEAIKKLDIEYRNAMNTIGCEID